MSQANRKAWTEVRRSYIGGTDAAAIVGMNKYKTPLGVYLSKTGQEADDAGVYARMGTALEPLIFEMFQEETGLNVSPSAQHIRHPEYPFLGGNPDGVVHGNGQLGLLECKTYDFRTEAEWGDPGTDQIPLAYYVQCTWYLGLTKYETCWVAALHRTMGTLTTYVVKFDQELYDMLVAKCVEFWNNHIAAKVAPEVMGGDIDYLKAQYPTDNGEMIIADATIETLVEEWEGLYRQVKPMEKRIEDIKARLIDFMGDAAALETMAGRFTYRQGSGKSTTDWKAIASDLTTQPYSDDLWNKLITIHTTTKPGARTLRTPFKESK